MNRETNGVQLYFAVFADATASRLSAAVATADSKGKILLPRVVSEINHL